MMKKLSALLLSLALLAAPAHGANQASVQTPTTGPHSATDFTTNFLNPALLALFTCNWGAGAPSNGVGGVPNIYQCWANTTTNPVVFNYYDGASWVAFGKLDTTAHTWTPVRQGTDLGTASTATTGTSGHTIPFLDGTNTWSATNTGGTWSGGSHIALTALGIRSTGAAFDVRFASSEVLTADRTLTWVLGDASRSITLNGNLSIGGALTFSGAFSFTGTLTGTTTVTFPTTGTLATLAGTETLTNKTFVCANQTSCVVRLGLDVTGTLLAGNFPALLGDVTTSAGSLTTVVGNLPTGVTAAGSILHTNIAAPGSPAAGKNSIWTDSTDLRFHDKNSAGVIGTTVVADTGAANNFLTAISAAGVISKSTIACAGLSDDGPFCNGTDAANLTGTVANARLSGSYTGVTGLGTVTTGSWQATVIGLAFGGSGQATALAARGSSGFNIDGATSTGDANYTILSTDRMVYHTALSAPRTDTLPAANSVNAGQIFVINDFRGVATGTNTVTLARAGADTINGVTSVVAINAQYGAGIYWSDGTSRWTFFPAGAAGSGTVTQVVCGAGLSGGTITSTGTCALAAIAADNVLANSSGSSAVPVATALTSCSSASSAMTYNTSTHAFGCNTIPAGTLDFRNILYANGALEVWQRGAGGSATFTIANATTYTADRWFFSNTSATQSTVVSQVAGLTNQSRYSAKIQRSSGQAGVTVARFAYPLETEECFRLRGQNITLSFTYSTGANWSPASGTLNYIFYTGTGTEGKRNATGYTGEATPLSSSSNLATGASATTVTFTGGSTVATTTTQCELQFNWTPSGTAGANDFIQFDDVQLEVGSTATTFERTSFRIMLSESQRHYAKSFNYATAPAQNAGLNSAVASWVTTNASTFLQHWRFPVPMRSSPTITVYNPSAANTNWSDSSASATGNTGTEGTTLSANTANGAQGTPAYIHVQADAGL